MTTLLTKISIYMTLVMTPNAQPLDFNSYLNDDEITMETCDSISTAELSLNDCKKFIAVEEIN